jgi:general secretion pathway protein H
MPTLAVGNKSADPAQVGFTLIELMVVLVILAVATAGVFFYAGGGQQAQLDRDAQRLTALLESARHTSQVQGKAVIWQALPGGFEFLGLSVHGADQPQSWLSPDTSTTDPHAQLTLGPEPVIGPQHITLIDLQHPQHSLRISSDGLRPFSISSASP